MSGTSWVLSIYPKDTADVLKTLCTDMMHALFLSPPAINNLPMGIRSLQERGGRIFLIGDLNYNNIFLCYFHFVHRCFI